MTQTHLDAARAALKEYLGSTECGVCRAYAENINTAIEELIGMHDLGAGFVRYTDECYMLKRIMVSENGEQQTGNSESE